MHINKSKLYYIFVAISTLVFYIRYFNFNNDILTYGTYIVVAIDIMIFLVYWISEDFTKKERIIHACLMLGIFGVYYFSGMKYEYLLFTIMGIIGIKNKSMKKIMQLIFYVYFISLIVHIILVFTGVIEDEIFVKISSGKEVVTHRFGFSQGNTAFTILFTLICSYIYYKFDKIKIWQLSIIELISIALYFVFRAKTGLIVITLFLIGTGIYKFIKQKELKILQIFRKIEIGIVPFMFIGIYLFSTVFFGTDVSNIINKLISDRIKITNIYFDVVAPKLLPQNYEFIDDLSFDCLYSFIMSTFGILFTIVVTIAFVLLSIKLLKTKRYYELYIITMFALYSYAERMYINAFKNPSILFLGVLLYNNLKMFDCEAKNNEENCNNWLLFWKSKKRL